MVRQLSRFMPGLPRRGSAGRWWLAWVLGVCAVIAGCGGQPEPVAPTVVPSVAPSATVRDTPAPSATPAASTIPVATSSPQGVVPAGASAYAQFAGTYRFASGHAVGFYETHDPQAEFFPTALLYVDLQTGDLGAAFPLTGTRFAIGPAVGVADPARAEVTFMRDAQGTVSGLTWEQTGAPPLAAERVPLDVADVRYPGGDGAVTLVGRLVLPRTPGKHPAVVIVHGAGEITRANWLSDLLGGLFALQGVATLSYDKRGVGDSGGTYVGTGNASPQNLELLAGDALAGLTYLQGRSEIDSRQIGLQGSSQAGWIIPLAAARSPDVAFMILWSGPGVSQGVSDLYDRRAESTSRDDLTRLLHDTAPFGFDPVPVLEKVAAPGWWAFGGRDLTVPVPESIANLTQVKAGGGKDFTWQVFPTADHYLFDEGTGPAGDLQHSRGLATGLLNGMTTWLNAHIRRP
jgi:dienelactone hydrolase